MRHGIAGNKLGRFNGARNVMIRDIAKATIIHERVLTTLARAKEARKLVDRLITLSKKGTLSHKRKAYSILCDHNVVSDLFNKTSFLFQKRQGGYTRIIPLSNRRGDNAHLAYLELTEKKAIVVSKPKTAATAKKQDTKASVTDAEITKTQPAQPKAHAAPKETVEHPKTHPGKGDIKKDKGKSAPKIVSGFKRMFTKKPSD